MLRCCSSIAIALLCATSAMAQTLTWIEDGATANFDQGWCVASAGDLDGDGHSDLLIGCSEGLFGSGAVRVKSSATGQLLGTVIGTPTSRFGLALDGEFDVDGDGTPDFIVGAPEHDVGQLFDNRGRAVVYSGATAAIIHEVIGDAPLAMLGASVALLGDVTGDGHSEFVVGAPFAASNFGRITIHDGATGAILHSIDGEGAGHEFGTSVARIDDVTGDGNADLLVGAPYYGLAQEGRLYCLDGVSATTVWTITGGQATEHLGVSVAGLGDVNGDMMPDLVVGSPDRSTNVPSDGRATVCSGVDGSIIWSADGPAIYMKAGIDVDDAEDLNGDGIDDVLVGMPYLPP